MCRDKFSHEALAKPHHFIIAFALRVEIAAPFSTTHRQGGKAVFKNLLEGQKLQNPEIDSGVKAHAPLVRANGAVHLDTEATVYLYLSLVVDPGYAKNDTLSGSIIRSKTLAALYLGFSSINGIMVSATSCTAW
jgi:hypothetical protein